MKKIIFLCMAVFVFTVSIVNVVWFQEKKEHKAHLALNNIVALAQNGECPYPLIEVYSCLCAYEDSYQFTTFQGAPGEYVTTERYSCYSDVIYPWDDKHDPTKECRSGSIYSGMKQKCDYDSLGNPINCRLEYFLDDLTTPSHCGSMHFHDYFCSF